MGEATDRLLDRVAALLEVPHWVACGVDDSGRVLATTDEDGTRQLVELVDDGRAITRRTVDAPDDGARLLGAWYVPGRRAAVLAVDADGDENTQVVLVELDSEPGARSPVRHLSAQPDAFFTVRHVTATRVVVSTNRRNGVDQDLVALALDGGPDEVLASDTGFVAWARLGPGGRVAYAVSTDVPGGSRLWLARAGRARPLTRAAEEARHSAPQFLTPDTLLVSTNAGRDRAALRTLDLTDDPTDETDRWRDWLVDDSADLHASVSPDARTVLVARVRDGATTFGLHDADATPRATLDLGTGTGTATWAADSARLLIGWSAATDPGSLLVVADPGASDGADGPLAPTRLVDGQTLLGDDLAAQVRTPTAHLVPAADGEQIPCFVLDPWPEADPRMAGSAILLLHGGPEALTTRGWSLLGQLLAATGASVLLPNIRGSAGYGRRWLALDDVERRADAIEDLRALHTWLGERGLDPARAALCGGSYGGYLVLAGLTMQPELWAAGFEIVGISSLVTFLDQTSPYRRALREREYGRLEEDRHMLEALSPMTHLDALAAPLFIAHGARDPRVPVAEAEQIRAALAARGVACELRVYPDEGHGLTKRTNQLDAYGAALPFLVEALRSPDKDGLT